MARRVTRLTPDSLADLPDEVRACLHWELDAVARQRAAADGSAPEQKQAWLAQVLLDWGSCGRVAYVDDEVAGFMLYAPPAYFGGSGSYSTAPVAEDAVQLATGAVFDPFRGQGLGRVLMQTMVKDLLQRDLHGDGVRAVEAVGSAHAHCQGCLLPVGFLQAVGFRTVRAHPRHPRLRLDVRAAVTWRGEVESALERLRGVVRPPLPVPASISLPRMGAPPV